MKQTGLFNPKVSLLKNTDFFPAELHMNASPSQLIQWTLERGEGVLSDKKALCISTGKFTGRSPNDRYIVYDDNTANHVYWGAVNKPYPESSYQTLKIRMLRHLEKGSVFVKDTAICSDERFKLRIRVITEKPYQAHFVDNMFIRLNEEEISQFIPDWNIISAPDFEAIPLVDQTESKHFVIIHFSKKEILIGGTGYTGEIKKSVFSILNYLLPLNHQVLPMHCAANEDHKGNVALFFGLSGTGKTTLSTDRRRMLIGDDEHGWSDRGVFNFEGGCYAKCIGLSEEREPEIYHAIKPGAILENTGFYPGTNIPNYSDKSITENTRVSYPIHHVERVKSPSIGGHAGNIFFLTCDAFGVLPPISRLTPEEAKFYFINGYTSKIAGTEEGVLEPQATFSACFGAPFLPLSPHIYAGMLAEKIQKHNAKVWLVNTGWIGGPYGKGERIKLLYTRAMINAVLDGKLENVRFTKSPVFQLSIPSFCPGIPLDLLNPKNTWDNYSDYYCQANHLKKLFSENFTENFSSTEEHGSREIKEVLL